MYEKLARPGYLGCLNRRDILIIISFPVFRVARHFRLSYLNFLLRHSPSIILRLLHKFSNICKPEEGWHGQPNYCYVKTIDIVPDQLCSSLWTSRLWFLIFWLIRSLF